MKIQHLLFFLILFSCSKDAMDSEPDQITAPPEEVLAFEVTTNSIQIPTSQVSPEDISRTFYDVSGTFVFGNDQTMFAYYPGVADWSSGNSIDNVNPVASQILIKEDDTWNFFKTDYNLESWGMRNFERRGDEIIIGDGNEIGPNFSEWKGDVYIGKLFNNGDINWRKINTPNEQGFFHGTCAGDLNNDGLTDVGVTPGISHAGINLFLQNQDGSFTRKDELLNFNGFTPFTLDFADLIGDGIDEIITADYGGGTAPTGEEHEIRIYKFNATEEEFQLHFQINEPYIYDWGLGATSIKIHDFTNDGILDIAVAREDLDYGGFEVWKGTGNAEFEYVFSSPTWTQNELQFREFSVFDANSDGFLDILLRPFHYGNLYRNADNCWWNVTACNGIKLNHLIWLNNGDGTFDYYKDKDLTIEGINVDNIHPYLQQQKLHFVGTFSDNSTQPFINTIDIKVNF